MLKYKFFALFLSALCLNFILPTRVSADFGSGAAVLAEDLCLIKSGLCGEKICFANTDFKTALGVADFSEITITSIPKESEGTLIYAGRRAYVGQKIRRRNTPSLVFIPASDKVKEARFTFSIKGFADGRKIECVLKFCTSTSKAPVLDSPVSTVSLPENAGSLYGSLTARDPEGDELEFLVAKYPKYGSLQLSKNGEFLYTPPTIRTKSDSFSYVARDSFGNWSVPEKIEISLR